MVEAVLDGSIQKSDERVRITMRLIRVEDGIVLFAAQFDEKFSDNFSLQDNVSERIVVMLGGVRMV